MERVSGIADRSTSPYSVPSLMGRHVSLRPISPDDHDWLYRQATDPVVGPRWRLHGMVPSFDAFHQILHSGAEATFLMIGNRAGERLGMTQLLAYNERHGFAYLSAFFAENARRHAWPIEGFALFLRYVFAAFGLRKLYLESLAPEVEQFRSMVGSLFVEEGLLRGHEHVFGTYYDLHILALYRDRWVQAERDIFGPFFLERSRQLQVD
jgi:RimJ/RimL family protein N-acetyltransferase